MARDGSGRTTSDGEHRGGRSQGRSSGSSGTADNVADRVMDALKAAGQGRGGLFVDPDVRGALDAFEQALQDGRPIPPSVIPLTMRRLARYRDPDAMMYFLRLCSRSGHLLHPSHFAMALANFTTTGHGTGVHTVARMVAEYPGTVPAPVYSRLASAYMACGQYDRALRLMSAIRTMVARLPDGSTLGPATVDLGPVLWALLDGLTSAVPVFPRLDIKVEDRKTHSAVATARARAAAEVVLRHFAIAVQPSQGEANALLAFLCHDRHQSPYAGHAAFIGGSNAQSAEAQLYRHRAFGASMLWHRDFGMDHRRTQVHDPAVDLAVLMARREGQDEQALTAMIPGYQCASVNLSEWRRKWAAGTLPRSDPGSAEEAEGEVEEDEDMAGPQDKGARLPTRTPSDHGAWMEVLAHALSCKQIVQAADPTVLARCMDALAEHLGPTGLHTVQEPHRNDTGEDRKRVQILAPDSSSSLARLTLAEFAAGHVTEPYWARDRDLAKALWAPGLPGTQGPAASPATAQQAGPASASLPVPLVAMLPDDRFYPHDRQLADRRSLAVPDKLLDDLKMRSVEVRMALASQGYVPASKQHAQANQASQARDQKAASARHQPALSLAAPLIDFADRGRITLVAPGFGCLGPSEYASSWTSPNKLNSGYRGDRMLRVLSGLYLHLSAMDLLGRPYLNTDQYCALQPGTAQEDGGTGGRPDQTSSSTARERYGRAKADESVPSSEAPSKVVPPGAIRLRTSSHEAVLAALAHRQKTVAAGQVAAHYHFIMGGGAVGNAAAATALSHGIYSLLKDQPGEAREHIRFLFQQVCGGSAHTASHASRLADQSRYRLSASPSQGGPLPVWETGLVQILMEIENEARGRAAVTASKALGGTNGAHGQGSVARR